MKLWCKVLSNECDEGGEVQDMFKENLILIFIHFTSSVEGISQKAKYSLFKVFTHSLGA